MNRSERAIEAIRRGEMVILVDDEDRENEGDLVMAADMVTPEAINFMAKWGRGLICLTLTDERLRALEIPMMVEQNTSSFGTAFTVSIEARTGVSTGISAADRARTIQVAIDDATRPIDLVRPGHVFPLRAKKGGVLVRTGQTEGSVDLARLAGKKPAGVICEIMNDDGTMARRDDLERFAAEHQLIILSIAELIDYRLQTEHLVHPAKQYDLMHPRFGKLQTVVYHTDIDESEHVAVIVGDPQVAQAQGKSTLVRVQNDCRCGPAFSGLLCECGASLDASLRRMAEAGAGVFIGIVPAGPRVTPSLSEQLEQVLAPAEKPVTAMTLREFGVGAQILRDLRLKRIKLLSNHPRRMPGLEGYDIHLEGYEPLASARVGEERK